MRNITITRRKTFVGCAMKDQVYIRDEAAPELTIDGVPCRKIGSLKNGETQTFQLPEGEQELFLIVDKVSKDYCYARAAVPAEGDAEFSGKHHFVFGSNPFRFDGQEVTPSQKKKGRKGNVIGIGAVIVGVILGLLLTQGLQVLNKKTFTKDNFQITLTNSFEEEALEGFFTAYTSKTAFVFVLQEDKAWFGEDATLEEYAQLVLEANGRTQLTANQGDGFLWFTFTETPEDQELYYMAVCCESEDMFWVINFATPVENKESFHDTFLEWAASIEFTAEA